MTTDIKIDHNVKIPTTTLRGKYPWREMKKGDSFFSEKKHLSGISAAAALRIGNGCKFVTKSVTESGKNGTRVWRVS